MKNMKSLMFLPVVYGLPVRMCSKQVIGQCFIRTRKWPLPYKGLFIVTQGQIRKCMRHLSPSLQYERDKSKGSIPNRREGVVFIHQRGFHK